MYKKLESPFGRSLLKNKDDPARFEKAIRRQKISTFTSEDVKLRRKTKENKTEKIKMTRNIFGRMICLSLHQNVDLALSLQYPLTPVPLPLVHTGGCMNKT